MATQPSFPSFPRATLRTFFRRGLFFHRLFRFVGFAGALETERFIGRFITLLVKEMADSGMVRVLLVCPLDRLPFRCEVVVSLTKVHRPDAADGLLGRAQDRARLCRTVFPPWRRGCHDQRSGCLK